MMRVAIIGAGMAGLACARRLVDAGLSPVVFDKGRGIGGRIATRRVEGLQFDHGAQYLTVRDGGFAAVLQGMQAAGAVGLWDDGSGAQRYVGKPGMSSLARALAVGVDVRQLAQVTEVRANRGGWSVRLGDIVHSFDRVVITVPAPQVAGLLGQDHQIVAGLTGVHLAPCLTLMAATRTVPAFVSHTDADAPLAWIAQDSAKPGRPQTGVTTWVAQASPALSADHLEEDSATTIARLLPLLCAKLEINPAKIMHASAHRWRYARVTAPLGRPYVSLDNSMFVGGDWCLGPRVEAAWISGDSIGKALLTC